MNSFTPPRRLRRAKLPCVCCEALARDEHKQLVIDAALRVLEERARYGPRPGLNSPTACRDYLRIALSDRQREAFVCVFLDAQHRALGFEELFTGTLTQTSVFPREVVKRALAHNAASVIFAQSRDYPHQPVERKELLH